MNSPRRQLFFHRFEPFLAAFGILLLGCLAYLLLAGQLGYYRDDWYMIWAMKTGGTGRLFEMFKMDRPFMGLVSGISYKVVGDSIFAWQVYSLFLRVLSGWGFLWLMRILWPEKRLATFSMAALFIVYPGFFHQTNAITFSNHFISYGLSIFSVVFTLLAVRQKRWLYKIVFYLLSMGTAISYMLIYEYMIGIEAVRLLAVMYLQYQSGVTRFWRNAWASIKQWLPSALPLGAFLIWRLFIFTSTRPATDVSRLKGLYQSDPLGMGLGIIVDAARDFVETVYLAWFVPFYQSVSQMEPVFLLFGLLAGLAGAGVVGYFWFMSKTPEHEKPEQRETKRWIKEINVIGILWCLFAILPVVLAQRQVLFQDMLDRYTLHVTAGVAILLVGNIYWLVSQQRTRYAALAVFVGLGLTANFGNSLAFSQAWENQRQAWWQLSWRAPDLSDGTALILMLPESYRLSEGYEIWAPANLIYQREPDTLFVMGDVLNKETLSRIDRQDNIQRRMRTIIVTADFKNSLVMSLNSRGCLHVYDRDWRGFAEEEDPMVRMISSQSNIDLIHEEAEGKTLSTQIFGAEPMHEWCYYYQKGELAAQQGNWQEVVRLGNEALDEGLSPDQGYEFEWLSFYEGYLRLNFQDKADQAALQISLSENYLIDFCALFGNNRPVSESMDDVRRQIGVNLCPEVQN